MWIDGVPPALHPTVLRDVAMSGIVATRCRAGRSTTDKTRKPSPMCVTTLFENRCVHPTGTSLVLAKSGGRAPIDSAGHACGSAGAGTLSGLPLGHRRHAGFTDNLYFRVFQKLLTPLGYVVDEAFYDKNVLGKVDHDVFSKLMPPGTTEEELKAMSKRKDDCFCELYRELVAQEEPPMLKGLPEALATAKELGVRAIAVTNAQRGAGEASIASLRAAIPAADIIEGLVIGAECTRAKPHPDPYIEGMRQLGVTPSECLVFEDSRSGVRAGLRAEVMGVVGMRTSLDDSTLRDLGCSPR